MSATVARLKGVLSVDDGAIGAYEGPWADPPQEAYAMVSADGARVALVAARHGELAGIAPAILGSTQGSVYSVARDRPALVVAARADLSDVALRLSDMSGGRVAHSPGDPAGDARLDWGAVEAVADLPPAGRAKALLEAFMPPGPGTDPLVVAMGSLLARDRTYGLARLMARRDLEVLVHGTLPPSPDDAGRNGEEGPACPYAYADVNGARATRGVRTAVYGRLAEGLSNPQSAERARRFDEGVLSGAMRPWARHALLAEGEPDKDAYASRFFVNPAELGEAILLVRRIVAGALADPLSIAALAMPLEDARGLPHRDVSSHPSLVPWIAALFPEARFPRQFACFGQPPQGGVAIAMAWAQSRAEAVPLLASTGIAVEVVHDVSRMLNLPGDALCFGCLAPQVPDAPGAPVTRPEGQTLH